MFRGSLVFTILQGILLCSAYEDVVRNINIPTPQIPAPIPVPMPSMGPAPEPSVDYSNCNLEAFYEYCFAGDEDDGTGACGTCGFAPFDLGLHTPDGSSCVTCANPGEAIDVAWDDCAGYCVPENDVENTIEDTIALGICTQPDIITPCECNHFSYEHECYAGDSSINLEDACNTCGYGQVFASADDCIDCENDLYEIDVQFPDCSGRCVPQGTAENPLSESDCEAPPVTTPCESCWSNCIYVTCGEELDTCRSYEACNSALELGYWPDPPENGADIESYETLFSCQMICFHEECSDNALKDNCVNYCEDEHCYDEIIACYEDFNCATSLAYQQGWLYYDEYPESFELYETAFACIIACKHHDCPDEPWGPRPCVSDDDCLFEGDAQREVCNEIYECECNLNYDIAHTYCLDPSEVCYFDCEFEECVEEYTACTDNYNCGLSLASGVDFNEIWGEFEMDGRPEWNSIVGCRNECFAPCDSCNMQCEVTFDACVANENCAFVFYATGAHREQGGLPNAEFYDRLGVDDDEGRNLYIEHAACYMSCVFDYGPEGLSCPDWAGHTPQIRIDNGYDEIVGDTCGDEQRNCDRTEYCDDVVRAIYISFDQGVCDPYTVLAGQREALIECETQTVMSIIDSDYVVDECSLDFKRTIDAVNCFLFCDMNYHLYLQRSDECPELEIPDDEEEENYDGDGEEPEEEESEDEEDVKESGTMQHFKISILSSLVVFWVMC